MAALNELIQKIENPELRAQIQAAADKLTKQKKFGLVFEEHLPECTPLYDIPVKKGSKVSLRNGKANEIYTVLKIEDGAAMCLPKNSKDAVSFTVSNLVTTAELGDPIYPFLQPLDEVCNAPDNDLWHTLIESDNYHALQLLEYLYAGKVDCIYIDPPYNTGAKDWKYNNDYVDGSDEYRHSKWLSFMQKRLEIAKRLLNPNDSVLIVTIDEKEYLHLGCLLEEMFPEARMQMVSDIINPKGTNRFNEFSRTNEYIYYLFFGNAQLIAQTTSMFENGNTTEEGETNSSLDREWLGLRRRGHRNTRDARPNQFYPIFINSTTGLIDSIGDALNIDEEKDDIIPPEGCYAIFPLTPNGEEMIWGKRYDSARNLWKQGYIRVRNGTEPKRAIVEYLTTGVVSDINAGKIVITGRGSQNEVVGYRVESKLLLPKSIWFMGSHNADAYGSVLLKKIIGENRFTYPKSLYSVRDSLNFFVSNKPNALIVDFFAGSGTTLHAVNLLNQEDGGNRRCIMVTNNEISSEERKAFEARGIKQDDPEWENRGVARYVTWPRTVCSIEGHDVNGNPLKGNYIGSDIPMANGFKANAVFFKLGFLDKTKVSLGMQFKELLSTLWMKAGAIGKCPTVDAYVSDILILPENRMAILNDENQFGEFAEQLSLHPEIEVVYLVTDYESSYISMTQSLEGKITYQLYRDYLDNFRINAGRNSR